MREWLLLVGLAGCDRVFGIHDVCPAGDDDCDGIADAKDPCPADYGDRADDDGDGVGNVCDPNPQDPGDSILLFDPFAGHEPWTITGGSWTFTESAFIQASFDEAHAQNPAPPNIQPTLEVVVYPTYGGENASVGAYVQNMSNVPLECRVVHHATGDMLEMLLGPTAVIMTAGPLTGEGRLRIYGGQTPAGSIRCRARYGDDPVVTVEGLGGVIDPRDNFDLYGLHTVDASAAFESLVIYTVQ